jgi:exosortase A
MRGRSVTAAAAVADFRATAVARRWAAAVVAALLATAAIIAIFRGTAAEIMGQWLHSSAYNHSFLLPPIIAYLIWTRRQALARLQPSPSFMALLLMPAFGAIWWLAHALRVAEAEQFALAFMVETGLLIILGWPVWRTLAFPFLYALLLVPTGDLLLPALQDAATAATAYLLDLSGIPVFSEGNIIQIPTGVFVVAPGCAGLNFLLASLALSLLCADLFYRSHWKRVTCVAAMLAMSVAINWLRIYALIAFDFVTNHRTSIVDDHLLYGWGLFSLAMAILIWLAQRLQDPIAPASTEPPSCSSSQPRRWSAFAAAVAATVLLSAPFAGLALWYPKSGFLERFEVRELLRLDSSASRS